MPAVVRIRTCALALVIALGGVVLPATAAEAATHPVGRVGGSVAAAGLGQRLLAEAATHLGAPYVFGATGPQAFDCSGFTMYVFGRLGIALPRSSSGQYGFVRHVAQADRQVGDLIFFRLGGGGVNHVGIYAGNDQIVVAPKSGDHVRYEAIWTSAYSVGRAG